MAANLHIDTRKNTPAASNAAKGSAESKGLSELRDEFSKLLEQLAAGVNAQTSSDQDSTMLALMESVKAKTMNKPAPTKQDMKTEKENHELADLQKPVVCPAPHQDKPVKEEAKSDKSESKEEAAPADQEKEQETPTDETVTTAATNEPETAVVQQVTAQVVPVEPKIIKCGFDSTEHIEKEKVAEEVTAEVTSDSTQNELLSKEQGSKTQKVEVAKVAEKVSTDKIVSEKAPVDNEKPITPEQFVVEAGKAEKTSEQASKGQKADNSPNVNGLLKAESQVTNTNARDELQSLIAQRLSSIISSASSLAGSKGENGGLLTKSMNTNAITGAEAMANSKASTSQDSKASRMLTRSQTLRMMEKVESVLQEAAKSKDGKTITVRLNPEEFGNIKVDVSLRDSKLHARLTPEAPQVVALMRERASELQQMLRKLGLNVDSVSVTVTSDSFAGTAKEWENESGQYSWNNKQSGAGEASVTVDGLVGAEAQIGLQNDHWVA